ncbi:MAG: SycD/LcrH family type III secretion system chaperone SicA [Chlamydiales bacterium]
MENPQEALKQAIEQLPIEGKDSDKIKESLESLASKIFEKGMTPREAMGMSKEMVEGLYGFGYRLYNTGKYPQASQLFRLLILIDPTEPRYTLGLAACFHMQKDYENAAAAYMLCSLISPNDPMLFYHASDCYMQMNKPHLAVEALENALKKMKGREEFTALRDRASLTLEMAKQKEKLAKQNETAA